MILTKMVIVKNIILTHTMHKKQFRLALHFTPDSTGESRPTSLPCRIPSWSGGTVSWRKEQRKVKVRGFI